MSLNGARIRGMILRYLLLALGTVIFTLPMIYIRVKVRQTGKPSQLRKRNDFANQGQIEEYLRKCCIIVLCLRLNR